MKKGLIAALTCCAMGVSDEAHGNMVGFLGLEGRSKEALRVQVLKDETVLDCLYFLERAEQGCVGADEDLGVGLCFEAREVLEIANEMMERAVMACAWVPEEAFEFVDREDETIEEVCIGVEIDFEKFCMGDK